MNLADELDVLLRSRATLIVLITSEETRAADLVHGVCKKKGRPCYSWEMADGFSLLGDDDGAVPSAADPLAALEHIRKGPDKAVYLLPDFHDAWVDKKVKRKLRTVVQELVFTRRSIVVTTPSGEIPEELKDRAVLINIPLPDEAELGDALDELLKNPDLKISIEPARRERLLRAASGLTSAQAQRVFAKGMVTDGGLTDADVDLVVSEKKELIRESNALEFYPAQTLPKDVGGLEVLKGWLDSRAGAFGPAAKKYGLPVPKGIALIGIPGTGKTLSAKMVGSLWGLPLLRFDVGALFGSFVGESEERTRKALRLAEAVSPCVLWIDEMEKALAHGGNDSGTSTRVFGSILTWMSEKTAPCFVVATANDISALPPELLRRGRFDEIFFLDLPTKDERKAIFAVHLDKRGRKSADYDLKALAEASAGYVGAELEQAVTDAMYAAFAEKREFETKDVLGALKRLVPLSVSQRERVADLRSWLLEGRAQSASFAQADDAKDAFVEPPAEKKKSSR
ncbi:MAG: AAA family ATPase [Elusimicrobia bacterium]|nr:AAA family ATPase [Elusimicrobiota bacterium]